MSVVLVLKGLAGQDGLAGRLEKLQGEWVLLQTADEKHTDRGDDSIRMHIDGNSVTMTFQGLKTQEGTLKLDPCRNGQIDMNLADGRVVKGKYELSGDGLTFCFDECGKSRPDALSPRNSQWLEKWKRAAKGRCTENRG
jgi:uncharacterized protein (TIGR03067 family)